MTRRRTRRKQTQPTTADHSPLDYPTIRDRFLARHSGKADDVELLVEMGRYVQYCWLAEEHERQRRPEVSEVDLFYHWDQFSERQFDDLCVEGRALLDAYTKKRTAANIAAAWAKRAKPLQWGGEFLWFATKEAAGGFIGAIGILLFGLCLMLLQPELVKDLRSLLDRLLPTATQPEGRAPG